MITRKVGKIHLILSKREVWLGQKAEAGGRHKVKGEMRERDLRVIEGGMRRQGDQARRIHPGGD